MRRRSVARTLTLVWAVVAAVVLALSAGAPAAFATAPAKANAKTKSKSKPTSAPTPGWTVDQVRFEPLDTSGELDVAGGNAYRGAITVRPSGGSGVTTVNEVSLDDYVRGIAEVPSGWPAEALKAQAIAARTYALNQLGTNKQLCATDACQVYAGLAKERADSTGAWSQAVSATSGQVLLYKNAPILAMYSSSNGGRSVAGSRPYLRAAVDPDDAVSPLSHWRSTATFATLSSAFQTPGAVTGIEKTDHDTYLMVWQATDGSGTVGQQEVATSDFVAKLNGSQPAPDGMPLMLPSWRFDLIVDPVGQTVTFDGHGFGHGVGMSQYGALGKAERGLKAPDILASYYGGIRPVQLPPQSLPDVVPVVLADGASSAQVSSPQHFRVVDGAGNVLAVVSSGGWTVTPAPGGKVRAVPPADQQAPLAVTPLAVAAGSSPVQVSFHLTVPALVQVTVQPPAGPAVAAAPQLLDAGDVDTSVTLPATPTGPLPDGAWTATIAADAGGGRTATVPVGFTTGAVAPPGPAAPARLASSGPLIDLAALAGPAGAAPAGASGWVIALAILSLAAATGVVARNAVRFFQSRLDPTLR